MAIATLNPRSISVFAILLMSVVLPLPLFPDTATANLLIGFP
ncbi:hypothetical protein [Campylobacter iguaniorum]|nr:hypothetical protein [Campylobacter iguaniorum]